MPVDPIRSVVIVGGGTAGWMTAAAMAKIFADHKLDIRLVESEQIGTVGVGEATIPQILLFNRMLGINENEFVRATQGTFKLGIEFVDWRRKGHSYIHPFGSYGSDMDGVMFHHFWLHARQRGYEVDLPEFCLQVIAARQNKFLRPVPDARNSPLGHIAYAFQFDASLYAAYLRRYAENLGVTRTEGRIADTGLDPETGHVRHVQLENGESIEADFFIDCSGFRGLLIEQALETGYEDWSSWLPCNRALAVPSENVGPPSPYTRATARKAGWQWRIPLQHRTGNGHVYCSDHISDDEAANILLSNLEGPALRDPLQLRFTTGHRKKFWNKNVLAIGLSAGFMEPLESTSIHLIQSGIARLMTLFPDRSFDPVSIDEYNRLTLQEYAYIRDFLVLHYRQTERDDSKFWRYCRNLPLTDHLSRKLALYETGGRVSREKDELFNETSWLAVLDGQGVVPKGHHPLVAGLADAEVDARLEQILGVVRASARQMPSHADFIADQCAAQSDTQQFQA
jgi:tryptophan halogenase